MVPALRYGSLGNRGIATMLSHIGTVLGKIQIRGRMLLAPIAASNSMHTVETMIIDMGTPTPRHPRLTGSTEKKSLAKRDEVAHHARRQGAVPLDVPHSLQPTPGAFFWMVSGKYRKRHLLPLPFHAI